MNSNKKLLKSITILEIEWKYLNLNKILSMNTKIFELKWIYLNLDWNLLNRIKIFECELILDIDIVGASYSSVPHIDFI